MRKIYIFLTTLILLTFATCSNDNGQHSISNKPGSHSNNNPGSNNEDDEPDSESKTCIIGEAVLNSCEIE